MCLGCGSPVSAQKTQAAPEAQTLALHQVIALALQNSRELALARVQYNVALNAAGVNRADFRPNVYTGSGLAYTNGFPSAPGGQAPSVFSVSYTQALFNPLLHGQLRAAEERAKNQQIELGRTRNQVIVSAASLYFELAAVKKELDLLRSEQVSAQKILDVTRERAAASLELPIEVTKSELASARVGHRIIRLEGRNEILEQQLRDMTALPAGESLQLAEEQLPEPAEESATVLVDTALAQSPAVKEAENERKARDAMYRGARGSYWPSIDLFGQYSLLSRFNNYDQFYRKFQQNNVNIGLQFNIPLLNWRTRSNVAFRKSQLAEGELLVGTKRQQVRQEVTQKVRNVREMDAAREVARLELKLAQQQLELTQAKFDQGQASLRELEQAHLDENEKWVAFLDADVARQKGQLALWEATGQLAKVFP